MRILVVGASGYIGGRLVPLLAAQGHELVLNALYPVHGLIFRGTVRVLAKRVVRRAEGGPPTT